MKMLTIENVTKTYGEKQLFNQISFTISEKERVGLIGVNGTGKSTLLKILSGVEGPEQGKVTMGNSIRLEYLPQNPEFEDTATVLQQVFKGNSSVMQLLREYELALEKLNADPEQPRLQQALIALGQRMDELDAWQLESDAKTTGIYVEQGHLLIDRMKTRD